MTEREMIKQKVLQIAEMHGVKIEQGTIINKNNDKILYSNGILQRMLADSFDSEKKFIDVIYDCLNKFFQGNLGEFEKYEEDLYHFAQGTPRGKYKIGEEVKTMFGTGDSILITPRKTDIIVCMSVED